MHSRIPTIALVLVAAGSVAALIWTQRNAAVQKNKAADSIIYFSNQLIQTSASLDQHRQVNTSLEADLKKERDAYLDLTNTFTQVSAQLEKSEAALKATRDEVSRRDTKIADLESQNQLLDRRAVDLSAAITGLTEQIEQTRKKLASSEGDKDFLEKELTRLLAEKADLESQFNDLTVLRRQVAKLKEELSISRRLEWIRQGLFARADQKGAEQLMQKDLLTNQQPKDPAFYDLNVEIGSDGTVRVIPSATNKPSGDPAANSPPPQ